MDDAALIDHELRSVSEIPLVRRISSISSALSSAAGGLSPPREPATSGNDTSTSGGNDASPVSGEPVGAMRSGSAPATAAVTADEDVSKLDLAIIGCTITLLVAMVATFGGLGWKTPWKVLYGSLMIVSFVSTITGLITAVVGRRAGTRRGRLSPSCARMDLVVAAALFVVFLSCKLARFGCLGGVAAAAVVIVVLAVAWVLSEPPTAAEEGVSSVSLPPDAP